MTTPTEVAKWMFDELKRQDSLYQNVIAFDITKNFGGEFTFINTNGNLAINIDVLEEFRKITSNSVVWVKGERCWRFRQDYDSPTKRISE
jgi:hypothetical protein